jgi:DNA ligase-associated metallophosphoesterase
VSLLNHNREFGKASFASDAGWVTIADVGFAFDLSGALYWPDERLLVVSDLHLEKGSSFAQRGTLLPPYDTAATLARLTAAITKHNPRRVIALGDSFHDRDAHLRVETQDRALIATLQSGRDWTWVTGNHDPAPPEGLGGGTADEIALGPIVFRHEPTGAEGEIAGHLHPTARISTRGRALNRRCLVTDGDRAVLPAFGAYSGGISIRDHAFARIFSGSVVAHVIGDRGTYAIAAERCY